MIVMLAMPFGRAGTTIAGRAEIVARLAKPGGGSVAAITRVETGRTGWDIEGRPVAEDARWRIRILDDEDEAPGSLRYPGPGQS